jgi:hypothetical protein
MVYEEIITKQGSERWSPEKIGDQIEGKLSEKRPGMYGMMCFIENEDGTLMLPNHKVLQNRLEAVEVGKKIKVVYDGQLPTKIAGRKPTELYTVFVDK